MKQSTKNWLAFGLSMLAMVLIGIAAIGTANAGGYKIIKHYHSYNVTNVTNNYSSVSGKDLATVGAMAGAASSHHFTRGTKSWQGSFGGACFDSSSDDCALSFAIGKRPESGDYLYSLSVTGASDERLISGSIGWTF